jgi:hypothetical protein
MSDRTSSLTFERNVNHTHRQTDEALRRDEPRTSEPWIGRRPAALSAAPLSSQHSGGVGNIPVNSSVYDQASNRKSYFARLLDALHESRRLQAERIIRDWPHLVREERK